MNRIVITENDETRAASEYSLTEAVLIPGFATAGSIGVPVYCETVSDLLSNFCTKSGSTYQYPTFTATQYYSTITFEAGTTSGFVTNAIPLGSSEEGAIFAEADTIDPSFNLAIEILNAGLPVWYVRMNNVNSSTRGTDESTDNYYMNVKDAYRFLKNLYTLQPIVSSMVGEVTPYSIADTDEYDIKFLTTGGYPTYEFYDETSTSTNKDQKISKAMLAVAAQRGDCVALIDHTNSPTRALTGATSVFGTTAARNTALADLVTNGSYGALFTPWCTSGSMSVPASIVYLLNYAKSVKNNPNWLTIAGTTRGYAANVTECLTDQPLTNTIADYYQVDETASGQSINAITYVRPTGYCIWGNRTLAARGTDVGFATTLLNVRNMVNDIKKRARQAAKDCMFEQNTDVLWVTFKSKITPLLDQMVQAPGIKNYKILKLATTEKQRIYAEIRIQPHYSVEAFDIDLIITDSDVEVSEA